MAKQRSAADLQRQLDALQASIKANEEKGLAASEAQLAAKERITKELTKQKNLQEELLHSTKEMDDALGSIAKSWGKTSRVFGDNKKRLDEINAQVKGIVSWSNKLTNENKANRDAIQQAAAGYKSVNTNVLKNLSLLADGQQIHEDIYGSIEDQIDAHKKVIESIKTQTKDGRELKATMQEEVEEMEKLAKAAKKAESNISAIAREGEKFAGTMLGGGIDKTLKAFGKKDGLGGVIKSIQGSAGAGQAGGGIGGMLGNVMGGVSKFLGPIGLAVGGIMAAAEFFNSGGAAKMAMRLAVLTGEDPMKASEGAFKQSQQYRDIMVEQNYKLPLKLQQQASDDYLGYRQGVEEDAAKYKESLISDEIDYRMSLESDAISFRQQQASAELDAQLSRQKTLFTSGMGYMKQAIGIGERALQAIGSSTAAVLDTVKEYGYTLGIALKDQIKLSAAAQGLAVRYGTSATEVFKMADTFRLMNKTSAKTGANLVAGLEDLAKKNDMSPAQLYKEMADAQADILKYSSYTTEEYARQAIELGNMNTSMANMLKASDSMVLNYKDSIKAEMSLSAMLGKNVNFSEVRAKLMSGDQAGGAAALKTALGGQDINAMNAFQKQALSQATGMGIQELMQLTQSQGGKAKGTLEERNAEKTGKAIANGALSQDIANAAAKLALDQKNRAEMLKFEQAKRMAMLFVEQKFRLNAIEREFKYREEREQYGIEKAKQNAQMDMFAEVAGEQIMSITDAYKSSMGPGKFDQAKVDAFKAETTKNMDILQQAMVSGRIDNAEMVDIAMAMQKAAMQGKQLDISQFAGVQKYNKDYEAQAKAENAANAKMVAAFEKLETLQKNTKDWKDVNVQRGIIEKAYPNAYKDLMKMSRLGRGSEYIAALKKQKTIQKALTPGGATVNTGKGGKPTPVVLTPPKSGTKPDAKGTPISLPKEAPKLTDSQAQTKLQVQMVKLMGVSAQYLAQIDAKTTGEGGKIDGKVVANSLLNAANRQYGIAGVSY